MASEGAGSLNSDSTGRWWRLPELPAPAGEPVATVIVGAGLAGCWLARELAERGQPVRLLDAANSVAAGASGNPVGVVKPHITRDIGPTDHFYQAAFTHLLERLRDDVQLADAAQFTACGVLQLVHEPFSPRVGVACLDAQQASRVAGVPVDSPALWFEHGGHLSPAGLCTALIDHPLIELAFGVEVADLRRQFDVSSTRVVLACGASLQRLWPCQSLPLVTARGQITELAGPASHAPPRCVISGRHYVIPQADRLTIGATFERGNECTDVQESDHQSNLAGLDELLPGMPTMSVNIRSGRAGVRCTTPDRQPIVGALPDVEAWQRDFAELHHGRRAERMRSGRYHRGLFVLGGLGSRGIVTAPYLAHLLAGWLMGSQVEHTALETLMPLVHPARFLLRRLRRAPSV